LPERGRRASPRVATARAFLRQAKADFEDARKLIDGRGNACAVVALLQGAAEKAIKAYLALQFEPAAFFEVLKQVQHEPIKTHKKSWGLQRRIPKQSWAILQELEAMQPRLALRSSMNPQYPWTTGATFDLTTPVDYFQPTHVTRFKPVVGHLLAAVAKQVR